MIQKGLIAAVAMLTCSVVWAQDDLLDGGLLEGGLLEASSEQDDDALLGDDSLLEGDDLLGGSDDLLGDSGGLLDGDSDLLSGEPPAAAEADTTDVAKTEPESDELTPDQIHRLLFEEEEYPSANTCGTCHPVQFEQWAVSQHAYAQISPVYMAMQRTINAQTSSTNGDFCIRCHTQIGMNKGESPFISNLDRHPASSEGITCVVCHRLSQPYGKVSGRVALETGDLTAPVYGPTDGQVLQATIDGSGGTLTPDPDKSGRKIHGGVRTFEYIGESGFCGVCHDVNLFNGFRLEEAFSDYKQSPAAAEGTSCQDCHMGTVQGKVSDYAYGPAAMIGSKPTPDRKLTNHFFAGPDYSIVHPGIFPHNIEATKLATPRDWLKFDHEAGWGTDAFEDSAPDDYEFPERWRAIDDRYDARAIIDEQFERLEWARTKRLEVLRNGFGLSEVSVTRQTDRQLKFELDVKNIMNGHSVPTGFDAERVIWLYVAVKDADGKILMESGDLDPNGDVRDSHSIYVHNGELPLDTQLFNMQSKFITRNVRGGEREQVLTVNYSVDPLPFIRPSTSSTILTGQPAGARKHRHVLSPGAKRTATYRSELNGNGPYTVTAELKAAMVPVNLVAEIQHVGFDYGMSPRDVADGVVAGHMVIWERKLEVGGATVAQAGNE